VVPAANVLLTNENPNY